MKSLLPTLFAAALCLTLSTKAKAQVSNGNFEPQHLDERAPGKWALAAAPAELTSSLGADDRMVARTANARPARPNQPNTVRSRPRPALARPDRRELGQ